MDKRSLEATAPMGSPMRSPCATCPPLVSSPKLPAASQRRGRGSRLSTDGTGSASSTNSQHLRTHYLLRMWYWVPDRCQHWGKQREVLTKARGISRTLASKRFWKSFLFTFVQEDFLTQLFFNSSVIQTTSLKLRLTKENIFRFPSLSCFLQVALGRWVLRKTCTWWAGGGV